MARPVGQGEKTKKLIAERAKVLFEQKGYAATSMEEIRECTQTSKGSIYYHFKSKEELFLYAVEESSKAWRSLWEEQANKVATVREKLYLLARYYATDMQNPLSKIVPEYIASEKIEHMMKEKIIRLIQPEYDVFHQLIEEGIRKQEFESSKNVEDLSYILYGTLTGLSITQFFGYSEERFYFLYEQAIDVFLHGISRQ
ncbi:TetR/AcrR family transcriptional regulator [Paenibacillus allorhizosphaerae]|uniref:HTH-type transcriptional regulator QacR n=1 Tax=Paenibacillus allorhizosphaerae TaxID=2849866 RepID=A0ABM8VAN2_9BACL|nr:TetR/AcrR family transcriptional regulator [Paenibacillus allorhizosphaerae]CAG7616349.1 HTH-type transcriptional regulator QacR [Paenibacillus allorhizosphaerae]